MDGDAPTVLVTDVDAGRRELYAAWLADEADVRAAADADEALDGLSPAVDLVILDRDMPGPSGRELARRLAAAGDDPHIAMVGAESRDFDLAVEPVDDYVRKPVREADARAILETYRTRREYDAALEEFYALTAKLASIETGKSADALANDERYRRLQWLVEEKRAAVDEILRRTGPDWPTAFGSLAPGVSPGA